MKHDNVNWTIKPRGDTNNYNTVITITHETRFLAVAGIAECTPYMTYGIVTDLCLE